MQRERAIHDVLPAGDVQRGDDTSCSAKSKWSPYQSISQSPAVVCSFESKLLNASVESIC
jgi:hypothetical protein